jgi:hypothetical protein
MPAVWLTYDPGVAAIAVLEADDMEEPDAFKIQIF